MAGKDTAVNVLIVAQGVRFYEGSPHFVVGVLTDAGLESQMLVPVQFGSSITIMNNAVIDRVRTGLASLGVTVPGNAAFRLAGGFTA
jgi:hypothetical protein